MDFLEEYTTDAIRKETPEEQRKIQELISQTCEELGYNLVRVPLMSVSARVSFIKKSIK
jgi:predicted ATPase